MLRLRFCLRLNGEVSAIRFGDRDEAQLQAGAARGIFDFWNRMQDFFDVLQDFVGFRERTARRRVVIQNESALIHFRQQVGSEKVVANQAQNDNNQRAGGHRPTAAQDRTHDTFVKIHDAAKDTRSVSVFQGQNVGRPSMVPRARPPRPRFSCARSTN